MLSMEHWKNVSHMWRLISLPASTHSTGFALHTSSVKVLQKAGALGWWYADSIEGLDWKRSGSKKTSVHFKSYEYIGSTTSGSDVHLKRQSFEVQDYKVIVTCHQLWCQWRKILCSFLYTVGIHGWSSPWGFWDLEAWILKKKQDKSHTVEAQHSFQLFRSNLAFQFAVGFV